MQREWTMQRWMGVSAVSVVACLSAAQDAYVDLQGRTWRQVVGTTGRTWDQVNTLCPSDGSACSGSLAGLDLTGWIWASQEDVLGLFAEFAPEILSGGSVGGPAYTLAGLGFTGVFTPTSEFYTVVGGFFSISGWTRTVIDGQAIVPGVSASYNPHDGAFSVLGLAQTDSASQYRGVWLYRAAPGCPADLNADGSLNFFDISSFVTLYNAQDPAADLDNNGLFTFFDLSTYLNLYGAGCP